MPALFPRADFSNRISRGGIPPVPAPPAAGKIPVHFPSLPSTEFQVIFLQVISLSGERLASPFILISEESRFAREKKIQAALSDL